jgi:hypothetical protein
MQLELPAFSQFSPSLLLLLAFGVVAAWGWSLGLLASAPRSLRLLPAWAWAIALVVAPIVAVPLFLLFGVPPLSRRTWVAIEIAVVAAIATTVAVVAIEQIGIVDCRVVHASQVCEMEPRSALLPVGLGIAAAIFVGTIALERRHPDDRRLAPLAT